MFVNNASRSIAALLLGVLLFAPQAVLAQNECGATDGDPNTPDTVTCVPGDYDGAGGNPGPGITYASDGDFTLEVSDGPDNLRVFQDGISVTGNADDNITFDATAFTQSILNPDAGGAIIDYASDTGDITILGPTNLDDARIGGGGSDAEHAIRAHSGLTTPTAGDGGDIVITVGRIFSRGGEAIEAVTDGGDIVITGLGSSIGTTSSAGIYAETGGAGLITMDLTALTQTQGSAAGPGIHAVSGGDILLDASSVDGNNGIGILMDAAGMATINVAGIVQGEVAAIQGVGDGSVVFNATDDSFNEDFDDRAGIQGGLDFSGLGGSATLNLGADTAWQLNADFPTIAFSGGGDTVTTAADSLVFTPLQLSSTGTLPAVTVQFGDGNDVFQHGGTLMLGPIQQIGSGTPIDRYPSEVRFQGLETFEHSGTIWLGHFFNASDGEIIGTDSWPDDLLAMPGVDWIGVGDNLIRLDVDLGRSSPTACDSALRSSDGDLPAADCLDLTSGTATGRSFISINQRVPGDRGAYSPDGIVLVDLAGSDPADTDPEAFVIHPSSQQYSPAQGGVIDKGVFLYTLAFDAETQQFKLFGLPSSSAQQFPLLGQAANGLWRTATDAWFDRRVDQRDLDVASGLGGGVWIRGASREGERDVTTPIVAGVDTLNFDNGYTQDDSTLTFGLDLVSRSTGDSAWVFGGMVGYTRSRVQFDATPNTANFEGMHAGLYGSATFGDFFVDAVLNGAWQDLDNDIPALELTPETAELSTDLNSYGGQVEAGWRWRMGRLTVEPLAGLSYVKTSFEKVSIPAGNPNRFGAELELDDPISNRGSLGVRARLDNVLPGFAPTSVGLTARAIEEFDGESEGFVINTGPLDAPISNTFDGTFGQLTGDVSITNVAKTAAGYLKVDAMTGDDYDSLGVSAGFRYQW